MVIDIGYATNHTPYKLSLGKTFVGKFFMV